MQSNKWTFKTIHNPLIISTKWWIISFPKLNKQRRLEKKKIWRLFYCAISSWKNAHIIAPKISLFFCIEIIFFPLFFTIHMICCSTYQFHPDILHTILYIHKSNYSANNFVQPKSFCDNMILFQDTNYKSHYALEFKKKKRRYLLFFLLLIKRL